MSTPGKVLVVLVLLLTPVWIILISAVAQLNKNAGAQVKSLKEEVASLEKSVAGTKEDIVRLKDDIELEQLAMATELAAIRGHQANLQKARSEILEIKSRVQYQLASTQEAVKDATTTKDLRIAEKNAEKEALQTTQTEVEKLQQEHAQLVEELGKLRNEFKSTVDSNRQFLARFQAARP
jgi:DNA repair exonuclease SbcCD ATPase subunit